MKQSFYKISTKYIFQAQMTFFLLLGNLLYAGNTCSKWMPLLSDSLVVVLPLYDMSITEPDLDCDGVIDILDKDIDGDGVLNDNDAFPNDASESVDTDNDGIGNSADADDDNDGYNDAEEIAAGSDPLDVNSIPLNEVTLLFSGIGKQGIADKDTYKHYKIYASAGDTVKVDLYDMDADGDLYVKIGSKASKTSVLCKSENSGKDVETCSVTLEDNADIYMAVYAAKCIYNVQHTIKATIVPFLETDKSLAKIFMIGDSTVQNRHPKYPDQIGWGSKLSEYMKNADNVYNYAIYGKSSESYKNNHWENTKQQIEVIDKSDGAYLLIQFGHNDKGFAITQNDYYNNLKTYVDNAIDMNIIPVLITPVSRKKVDTHGEYPETVRKLAVNEKILLLDLQHKSKNELIEYSQNELDDFFDDGEHFSHKGAKVVAGWVEELACKLEDKSLCAVFKNNPSQDDGINKDIDKLYKDLNADITSNQITIKHKNKILLKSGRSNFNNNTNTLLVTNNMTKQKGGFDVLYTVKNKTNERQNLDLSFIIPGIKFIDRDSIHVLNTQTYFYPVDREISIGKYINIDETASNEDHLNYPRSYSPVIVAHDEKFAVGASIETNYVKDKIALSQRVKHELDGTWSFIFKTQTSGEDAVGNGSIGLNTIAANKSISLKINIRFSDKRYWLMTLAPYKKYFNILYSDKDVSPRDTRPVIGLDLAYGSVAGSKDNLRGYNYYTNLGKYGFDGQSAKSVIQGNFTNRLKTLMTDNGYSRVMLWAMGGQFGKESSKKFNIPTQFMSNIPDKVKDSFENTFMDEFKNANIDYGFWWGRSGQVPYRNGEISTGWNSDSMKALNIQNQDQKSFVLNELKLAHQRGAKEIGLDAFTHVKTEQQVPWLKEMKRRYPSIKFWEESVQRDSLHTESSLFLQPNVKWFNKDEDGSKYDKPPLLANYLNPNAEVLVWLTETWGDGRKGINSKYVEKLTKMGYTPILIPSSSNIYGVNPFIDLTNMDSTLYECCDGIDNDADGKVDWPYDEGCESPTDEE